MIQPADIKSQEFKKGLFGYKASDVISFKDSVYRAYNELFNENAELSENLAKLNESLKESRLKIFELENQVLESENGASGDGDIASAKKKAADIIKEAEAQAVEIVARAKSQSENLEKATGKTAEEPKPAKKETKFAVKSDVKTEAKQEEKSEDTGSSKFFKKSEDTSFKTASEDDDEIFVGEIEDARKRDRMMIGDGEEEEDMDFEFL